MPVGDRKPAGRASTELPLRDNPCWCGADDLRTFSPHYSLCGTCHTLVTRHPYTSELFRVEDDDRDFYGRDYWFSHQEADLGQPGILSRARTDLPERAVHWLRTVLKYKQPPGRVLELGSAHGGFVALLRTSGFDAAGLEMSPWIVAFARETFDVPMHRGTLEQQSIGRGSLDAIVLMDVLEHLPDPVGTMRHAVEILKPDGILVIQTPQYPTGMTYESMVESQAPFLAQLKSDEHLFLFSDGSIEQLLSRAGASHLVFEPAIFGHYDMFVVASPAPVSAAGAETISAALLATPGGRLVHALLDLADQRDDAERRCAGLSSVKAEVEHLKEHLTISEADRAARLQVIEEQGAAVGRLEVARQEAERAVEELRSKLHQAETQYAASEEDRAALSTQFDAVQRAAAEARRLVHLARSGSVLRVARALAARGADAALGRAEAILDYTREVRAVFGKSPAAEPEPPPVAASATPDTAVSDDLCAQIRDPKTSEPFHYTADVIERILGDLSAQGINVQELTIDPAEYRAYFDAAGYAVRYPEYYSFNLPEKSLEHFLAAKLLGLGPGDVYVDIASEHSPVPEIYARLFGCTSYRQDLAYPEGLQGDTIGGDAAAMPVPDGFATKMALHCSFEHFEGDADERFVREIGRVLRPGGRVCFAPLYLWDRFGVLTDPAVAVAEGVGFDAGALVVCRPGWGNRHGRLYDAAHLASRIVSRLGGMALTIFRIPNATDVDPGCYVQFAAVIAKPVR
jgi:SAM-dependent methyltransferase